ncbi:unnamed protein product [Discosporangium mesarthrocarpum]
MKTPEDVRAFFRDRYPSVFGEAEPSEDFIKDLLARRPSQLVSTYCSSLSRGRVALIGDAGHSMWASLGQGVNAAMEDCKVFAEALDAEAAASASTESSNSGLTASEGGGRGLDVLLALERYNNMRLEDVVSACRLSEEGMGGARSMRPAFMVRLLTTVLLNKMFGSLAPKVLYTVIYVCVSSYI